MTPRTKVLLGILLALGSVYALWYLLSSDDRATTAGRFRSARSDDAMELPEVQPMLLADAELAETGYDAKKGRNLFLYTTAPPDPAELEAKRKAAEERARLEAERRKAEEERRRKEQEKREKLLQEQAKAAENAEPPPPPGPKPPEIRLSYMGYVGPMDERVAVLLDPDGKIVVGKEGEVIQDDFRILRIGFTYLEMGYVKFEGSKPLPLGGEGRG